jgi:hypothetical protein
VARKGARQVLVWVLLALLGILFIALCIPLRVKVKFQIDDAGPRLQASARWFFWRLWRQSWPDGPAAAGLNRPQEAAQSKKPPETPTPDVTPSALESETAQQIQTKTKETGKAASARKKTPRFDFAQLPLIWNLWQKYWRSLFRLLHCRLRGDFLVELQDPALAGNLFGLAGATNWSPPWLRLELQFGYTNRINGDADAILRVYPLEVLWLALRVAAEPPVRRLIWAKITKKGETQVGGSTQSGRTAGEPHFQQNGHR